MKNETKNTEPIISVIIPVYNGASKIGKCLENLDKQTIKEPFEVIIVDDASPDNSGQKISEIIQEYMHPARFKIIICKENGRAGKARNIGINNAQGKYVVFIDQDDYPDPDMLRVLYELIQNGKYDCSACDIADKSNNEYHRYPCRQKETLSLADKLEIIGRFGYVFAILVKRQLIIENQHYFPENLMFEDSLYTYGLIGIINSMNNTDKLLYYRNEDQDAQTAVLTRKKLMDRITSTEQYLERYKDNDCIVPLMNLINQFAFYYIFLSKGFLAFKNSIS